MLSVIVKALNEEAKIAGCIESILRETKDLECEIIIVDSLSEDATVSIAKQFPVRVVQFLDIEACGCGSAAQLGYQASKGDLIYLIDADMEMISGFLEKALSFLTNNPSVAGVGGIVVDTSHVTVAERKRRARYSKIYDVVEVKSLGGGGLYRRCAIEDVFYFSHRGLKAAEELELGLRLHSKGWRLARLPVPSVMHSGHQESYVQSMKRLWRNGRLGAYGVLIRSSIGKNWFLKAVARCWFMFVPVVIILGSVFFKFLAETITPEPPKYVSIFVVFFSVSIILLTVKQKSFKLAFMSFLTSFFVFLCSIRYILKPVPDPTQFIQFREL